MDLVTVFVQNYDLPDLVLRKCGESLVSLVSFISGIGSYFPRYGTSLEDILVTVFSGIYLSLCNIFTAKCRIIHLNQLYYKVRAVILKSQIMKCKHEFYNKTQLMHLVRVFSQNYDLPDLVLRESLVCLVSFISGIGSFFPRNGTSLVDFSVTIFSRIGLSLCNTFTAKGISNSI